MSLQDPLPLQLPPQPSQPRRQEADLLQRLHQARLDPALTALRQLLSVRLVLCQGRLVKASLNDVPLLQGEARFIEKLLSELSGERGIAE